MKSYPRAIATASENCGPTTTHTLKDGAIRTKPACAGYSIKLGLDRRIGSQTPILLPMLILMGAIASCSAVPTSQEARNESLVAQQGMVPAAAPMPPSDAVANEVGRSQGMVAEVAQGSGEIPQAAPQLIKTASMTMEVEAIEEQIPAINQIVKQKQGDLLQFEDNKPRSQNTRHVVSMQLRVPQQQLENTINAIAELGTVINRSITAEDVSAQLIDNDARLKNLRKQEEMILKIMERSGSVGDVLNAARELSTIREQIERIDAVQANLRNKVAYSTLYLTLESPISAAEVPQKSLGKELQKTWENASEAVGDVTVGLLKFTLYLLAFSPFILLGAGVAFLGYNRIKQSKPNESRINHNS
ncbi:DUF4349 domain-containing protein [Laspinema olomoucense]|uniref:DUF4349 domain-containing protein n=1 Tax=Laspinema olomoucense D3b TaxID=2953688 RepID=A0ABT2N6D6_9CYAN|nr:DUF4349 domain-containing protein [Laspinema sp. D3b]MCT7978262.1 DUF4349 domain-containing protein [Laspinema sp. D3b]